jgi:hypothetical protein
MTDAQAAGRSDLVDVTIVDLPLDAYRDTVQHHDELRREFSLITAREPSPGHSVPGRLNELIEELNARYAGFTAGTQSELDDAVAEGRSTITLVFRVPAGVKDAVVELSAMLKEADDFCRHGDLLTLAPPPDAVRFREWYLGEFVRQCDGEAPLRWDDYGN